MAVFDEKCIVTLLLTFQYLPIFFQSLLFALALFSSAAAASALGPPAYGGGYPVDYPDVNPVYNFGYDVYNEGDGYQHQAFHQKEDRDG